MAKKQKEDGKAMAMPVDEDGKEGKLLSVSDMLASVYGPKI